jgi:hypothetical protein
MRTDWILDDTAHSANAPLFAKFRLAPRAGMAQMRTEDRPSDAKSTSVPVALGAE